VGLADFYGDEEKKIPKWSLFKIANSQKILPL
jgi:hypothetical protein